MSLAHQDDANWFLTLDETHHEFSTAGKKGSASNGRWVNESFPRSGERNIVGNFHTTGVYGTTLVGEALPPLYILSTTSKNEDDYKIDPRVCEGLPTVAGKYGSDKVMLHSSCLCVRKKGSMDIGLWHQYVRSVILPLYEGRISPEPIRDPLTGKLLSGPLIIKTDSGPGRLSREACSIEFREEMAKKGVHILLSLPNGTACTAEMDQLFEKFKPACSKAALRIAAKKMHARFEARKQYKSIGTNNDSSDEEDDDEDDGDAGRKKGSICNVSFSNFDLGHLVNGWPVDPIEDRPFDFHFTAESIIRSHIAVGFMPMTGRAALDPKVRFEFGLGGAPAEATTRMDSLREEYTQAGVILTEMGYNGAMLDIAPPEAQHCVIPEGEEAQIEHIVTNKLINKAGGLYKTGLIVANARVVLEGAKRVIAAEVASKEAAEKKKAMALRLRDDEGLVAHLAWVADGRQVDNDGYPKLTRKNAHAIVKILLPLVDIKGEYKLKDFGTLKACVKWLRDVGRGMNWDEHMDDYRKKIVEVRSLELSGLVIDKDAPPLFELGSV